MNEILAKVLKTYSIESHQAYATQIHNLSKDTIVALFTELLTTYINDKNSSTLREFITVSLAGYLRSANFFYKDFIDSKELQTIYCTNNLENYQDFIVRDFYQKLLPTNE